MEVNSENIELKLVLADKMTEVEFDAIWRMVSELLENNSKAWDSLYTLESIKIGVIQRGLQLWIGETIDEKSKRKYIHFALITKIMIYPKAKVMHYEIAVGEKLLANIEMVVRLLEEVAIKFDIDYMSFLGRKGFVKELEKLGYSDSIHHMIKQLSKYPTNEVH